MLTHFFCARWHTVDASESSLQICWLVQQEPVVRRGGQEVEGRREENPVRRARREMSSQYTRPAGVFAAGSVYACHGGHDECRDGRGGASGRVWRGGSSVSPRTFAARRKITLTGATFSVGAAVNRPRIWPQRRIAASSAASCAMVLRVVDECRCPKRHLRPSIRPKRAVRPPSSVCCRRVLNVLEGFASVFYISNKSRLLAFAARTRRRMPEIKRRGAQSAVVGGVRTEWADHRAMRVGGPRERLCSMCHALGRAPRSGGGGPQTQLWLKCGVTVQLSVNLKRTISSVAEYEKAHSRAWAGLVT